MEKKTVLLDIREIINPTCGFGQICRNYANIYKVMEDDEIQFNFLVSEDCEEDFGDKVQVTKVQRKYRWWKDNGASKLPTVNIWHSTNQQQIKHPRGKNDRFILTIHDLNYLTEKGWISRMKHHFMLQRAINKAAAVTCISKFVAKQIEQEFDLGGKTVRTIYNGVEDISSDKEAKPSFVTDRPFFFAIGQIRAKKNFHLLVDMMRHFPDYDLYVCGDDHFRYANVVREHINALPEKNAYLCGKISAEEKVWLYRHCEAFLFASQGEGFGLPAIEAMQFGKPVFISSFTCLPEICGDCAFVWQSLDPKMMADDVHKQLPSMQNTEHEEKAKAHAREFSYAKHIQKYKELYKEL